MRYLLNSRLVRYLFKLHLMRYLLKSRVSSIGRSNAGMLRAGFLRVKRLIPVRVRATVRKSLDFLQNDLPYLEFHLADHCNLNCKGCSHYCPVALPSYADLADYKADMQRLAHLLHSIREIRIMGGEPLLHPDPASFIRITRATFPRSNLGFATNGILLPEAPANFWEACRDTGTTIELTLYPPFRKLVSTWRALSGARGVGLHVTEVRTFLAHHNLEGNSDKNKAFRLCRSRYFCPFLQGGRIYTCAVSALTHCFNASFGTQIATDPGIDVHSRDVSGRTILKHLKQPVETCRWCAENPVAFPWSVSNRLADEWDAAAQWKARERGSLQASNNSDHIVSASGHRI